MDAGVASRSVLAHVGGTKHIDEQLPMRALHTPASLILTSQADAYHEHIVNCNLSTFSVTSEPVAKCSLSTFFVTSKPVASPG